MNSNKMIIVFYGELSTKGKNIMDFIRLLGKNIKESLKDFNLTYDIKKDHIYIHLQNENVTEITQRLKKVPGILSFSIATKVDKDMDEIKKEADRQYKEISPSTFKIDCKRVDKEFPLHSDDINRQVGGHILKNNPDSKVDVHHPELLLHITIREEGCYIYGYKIKGLGGYPLGIQGKCLSLLSGGIDSPVSLYLLMKRGIKVEAIHFMAPPYTSNMVIDKIKDLLSVLNDYQSSIRLYLVNFTELEKKIYKVAGPSYLVTIMRRMMMRISSIIAKRNNDLILATGESIGQVASQTLSSISVIDPTSSLAVIRPLATYDKTDIISLAQQIGTYEISIRPYEDCCTIFPIKDPVTHPDIKTVLKIEESFPYEEMIKQCVDSVAVLDIKRDEEEL
ncbi:MAG: tRNA uracil 4-sulfurtransferase ThiI [Candidatus Enterosoma sp.]|nr:tRNA 4-thiouridine(8) synthase ThiI [bacterium]MDY5866198.1 tRNA uracil 4-sulfurtransferase ThiI [Candidatus Enterosoma sp.]